MGAAPVSGIALRPFLPADARRCIEIFRASIAELASEEYDADQREAWGAKADDAAAFAERPGRLVMPNAQKRARRVGLRSKKRVSCGLAPG